MADLTAYVQVMGRGGFPAIGPKLGLIQATTTVVGLDTANDRSDLFTIPAGTLILCAGFEVVTASTNGVTASMGFETDGAGSATTLLGETATNATAGTNVCGAAALANVISSAASTVVLEISGDPGAAGEVRAWAIVADVKAM